MAIIIEFQSIIITELTKVLQSTTHNWGIMVDGDKYSLKLKKIGDLLCGKSFKWSISIYWIVDAHGAQLLSMEKSAMAGSAAKLSKQAKTIKILNCYSSNLL